MIMKTSTTSLLLLALNLAAVLSFPLAHNRQQNVAEETEAEENEIAVDGLFDTPVSLNETDIKTDILFPKNAIGAFEVELQTPTPVSLSVSTRPLPGVPPTGFVALDPMSYKIDLPGGSADLTLQKIDYIFDQTSEALKGVDIRKSVVGKFCTETGTWIVETKALGEQEFEVEEGEVTLELQQVGMEGEWAVFGPKCGGTGGSNAGDGSNDAGNPIVEPAPATHKYAPVGRGRE